MPLALACVNITKKCLFCLFYNIGVIVTWLLLIARFPYMLTAFGTINAGIWQRRIYISTRLHVTQEKFLTVSSRKKKNDEDVSKTEIDVLDCDVQETKTSAGYGGQNAKTGGNSLSKCCSWDIGEMTQGIVVNILKNRMSQLENKLTRKQDIS